MRAADVRDRTSDKQTIRAAFKTSTARLSGKSYSAQTPLCCSSLRLCSARSLGAMSSFNTRLWSRALPACIRNVISRAKLVVRGSRAELGKYRCATPLLSRSRSALTYTVITIMLGSNSDTLAGNRPDPPSGWHTEQNDAKITLGHQTSNHGLRRALPS